jgi:hypothetical protein
LKKTAGELPKLDFNAQLGQYNSTKFDQSFQVSQTIPFPSLFGAKKQLINAEIKGKELQKNLSCFGVEKSGTYLLLSNFVLATQSKTIATIG